MPERAKRLELPLDSYIDACIERIRVTLGFTSRKDAVRYALTRVADEIARGEIKKP